VAVLALMACGNPQEEARVKLAQLNLGYSGKVFVERAKEGDLAAVKLFLQAGMSTDVRGETGNPSSWPPRPGGWKWPKCSWTRGLYQLPG
jgi:hypothetical protein